MKKAVLFSIVLVMVSACASSDSSWSIGLAKEEGNPVIYKYVSVFPDEEIRQSMPWLTVVSWEYDGSANNGMPASKTNNKMVALEEALAMIEGKGELYRSVYSTTGNNRKAFAFYVVGRDAFMENFNLALKGHPAYPLSIDFYNDPQWEEMARFHGGSD